MKHPQDDLDDYARLERQMIISRTRSNPGKRPDQTRYSLCVLAGCVGVTLVLLGWFCLGLVFQFTNH